MAIAALFQNIMEREFESKLGNGCIKLYDLFCTNKIPKVWLTNQIKGIELERFVCKSVSDRTGMTSRAPFSSTLGLLKKSSLNNILSVDASSKSFFLFIRIFCERLEVDSLSHSS